MKVNLSRSENATYVPINPYVAFVSLQFCIASMQSHEHTCLCRSRITRYRTDVTSLAREQKIDYIFRDSIPSLSNNPRTRWKSNDPRTRWTEGVREPRQIRVEKYRGVIFVKGTRKCPTILDFEVPGFLNLFVRKWIYPECFQHHAIFCTNCQELKRRFLRLNHGQ